MHRERYEHGREHEPRRGDGRHQRRRAQGGGRTQERFEEEERMRQRLRGPGSWAGLQGDYGQQEFEDYGESERFAPGRFEDDRFGEDRFAGEFRGQPGRRGRERGLYGEPPGRERGERFDERGGFGSGEDWQQPRFLSGSYDTGSYGAIEQEEAWLTGGGAPQPRGARSGPHAGKGPKGWSRSDERILDDACEALERHPEIDASEIEVTCSGGEITLRGTVDSRHTKRLAEQAIEELPGVRDVRNELRAQPQTASGIQHGASEPGGGRFAPR
jgi:hypothetical protein